MRNFVLRRQKESAFLKNLKNLENVPGKQCAVKLKKLTGEANAKCTLNTTRNKQYKSKDNKVSDYTCSAKYFFGIFFLVPTVLGEA